MAVGEMRRAGGVNPLSGDAAGRVVPTQGANAPRSPQTQGVYTPRSPLLLGLALAVLLAAAVGLFFWQLGARDLWSSHEARAAMNAASALDGGLPRLFDGRIETQKPPLYYWLAAAAAWLRGGVDEAAVRLPSALAAAAVVILLVAALAASGRPVAGLLAGLILASGVHFPWLARIARIDVPLAFTVTLSALAFFFALRTSRGGFRTLALSIAWLACAVGVLLKGPIGLALPGAVVGAWLLAEGRWPACWEGMAWRRLSGELGVAWGLALVLLVCVPVFVWLEQASGGTFVQDFFWHHNVQRGLGGSRLRSHPWWLYAPYVMLYLLPYSPLLVAAFWRRLWQDDPLARLGLAWLVGVLVLLSAARFKRADYLLPAYPGAALFLGCVLARRRRSAALAGGVAALMLAGWAVRIGHGLPAEESYRDYRPFAAVVRRHAPPPAEVILFRSEAHALAFRVGRPLAVVVEWPDLRQRVRGAGVHHVVMPADEVADVANHLPGVALDELGGTAALAGGRHERPLVLLRMRSF